MPRIPTMQVQVNGIEPSEVTVTIDGAAIASDVALTARELNPGQHTVVARSKDGRESTKVVTVQEGTHETVAIDLATAQASTSPVVANATPLGATVTPPRGHITPQKPITNQRAHTPSSRSALPWIGVGIGSAGLVFGTAAGIVAYAKLKKADCGSDNRCPGEIYDGQGKNYNNWRKASTVGFIVGGAGAAFAGVTWLITRPKKEGSAQIGVSVGPSSWALEGTF